MEWDHDREAFIRVVRAYSPADADDFTRILDELIRWSREHDWAIEFVPHDGSQSVVKFALPGMHAPFWTAYPRQADGAKLCAVDSVGSVFPEQVRTEARRILAELDGREPEPNEAPTVSFRALRSEDALRQVKRLFCQLLVEMGRHA